MSNLKVWEDVRNVPPTAKKEIKGGRLSGMTDINPMWRLKILTEQFGLCGIGWKYEITEKRLDHGADGQIAAFVDINLYVKVDGEWSDGIPGTGGSAFVAKESRGLHVSDECFKMALTDAISVSCKALGVGADVYWDKDKTKYDTHQITEQQKATIKSLYDSKGMSLEQIGDLVAKYEKQSANDLTETEADKLIVDMKNWEAK